jgi:hypothetical protein
MHTFHYWYSHGYVVRAGERHIRRNRYGEPLFSYSQVKPRIRRKVVYYYD